MRIFRYGESIGAFAMHNPPFPARPACVLSRLAAGLLLLLAGMAPLFGEISAPGSIVPSPLPVKVEVKRGGLVEITLGVSGRQDEAVTFKIRSRPRYGKLSELKMTSGSVAVLTYRNAGDLNHAGDGFSYAVQTDQGVSAPGAVEITITDDPPIFVMPDRIDFGDVVLGSTAKKEIALGNDGSGVIDGSMDADKPWLLEQSPGYHLGPGGKQLYVLEFTPRDAGEVRGEIRYSGFPARVTSLHATGKLPFTAQPEVVELRNGKNDRVRTGSFQVTNETDAPERVALALPGRLQGPKEIDLAANETQTVTVKTLPDDVEALDASAGLSVPAWKSALPVRGKPLGPILQGLPETVSFAQTTTGNDATSSLTVKNQGGLAAHVRVSVPSPFQISEEDAAFLLEPGKERTLSILLATPNAGDFNESVRIEGAGNDVQIPVRGRVVENAVPKTARLAAFLAAGGGGGGSAAGGDAETPKVNGIPPVTRVRVSEIGASSCRLDWKAPAPGDLRYEIELRMLALDAHKDLRIDWVTVANVSTTTTGGEVSARLTGLPPQYPCAVRIRSIDAKGEPSAPSWPAFFNTKAKWHLTIRVLPLLAVALAVLLLLILRQRFFSTPADAAV